MARAWIVDRWLTKDAPPSVRRAVSGARNADRLSLAKVPARYRKARYGEGQRWKVEWFETDTAGDQRKRSKSFDARQAAEQQVTAVSDDQYSGRYVSVDAGKRTFRDVAGEYLTGKHDVKASTLRRYDRELRSYVYPQWGDRPIASIRRTEIDAWVTQLRAGTAVHDFKPTGKKGRGKPRTPQPLGASSVRSIVHVTFGGVMRYALKTRVIAADPLDDVPLPKDNTPTTPLFLTYAQVERLASQAMPRDATLIRFLAYTGLRPSEALALRVGDIDLATRRVHVRRTLTVDRDGRPTEGTPKTWQVRKVALPAFLTDDLTELCAGAKRDDYVFHADGGAMMSLANWRNRQFATAAKYAELDGLDGLDVYTLRHTFASLAIAAGCDVKTLQNAMGHKDATVTLNTYAALWPDRLDDVADAMAERRANAVSAPQCAPSPCAT